MAELWQRIAGLSSAKQQLLMREVARRSAVLQASVTKRHRPMTVSEMEAEAQLDPTITPPPGGSTQSGLGQNPPQAAVRRRLAEPAHPLLTGATGFVGAFLAHELLRQTSANVFCLVRAASLDDARTRLRNSLEAAHVWDGGTSQRLIPVLGDISQPRFGLDGAAFQRLAAQVDSVYHCAALVNWIYPYSALRDVNVVGTHEALRLATTHSAKPFHFVSTIGVFSSPDFASDEVGEDEPLHNSGSLHIGYAQSKWVAERLVSKAFERGVATTVFRPAVAPHSVTGVFKDTDHICRLIKGCVQLGKAPDLDLRIDLAPVDYVGSAIVHLSRAASSIGHIFHLVNPAALPWADVVGMLRDLGYRLDLVPYADWKAALLGDTLALRSNALFSLSPLLSEALIDSTRLPRFDTRKTLAALAPGGIECPPLDERLIGRYVRHFVECGFLPPPGAGMPSSP